MPEEPHGEDNGRTSARRPDATVEAEDLLRADFYDFLSGLLTRPPSTERLAEIARLGEESDDTEIGREVRRLAELARKATARSVDREFHNLFIGLGRGELLPTGSYYMTGFLNEKPLARLRRDMMRLRIERAPRVFEPEDSIAPLCEMMGGLIRGRFGAPASLETQREFFNAHLGPWAEQFFSDLEKAETARFYAPVGSLGRLMMRIEREAFRMEGAASAGSGSGSEAMSDA